MSDEEVEDAAPEEQKLTTVNPLAIQNNMQIVTRLCVPVRIGRGLRLTTSSMYTCTSLH